MQTRPGAVHAALRALPKRARTRQQRDVNPVMQAKSSVRQVPGTFTCSHAASSLATKEHRVATPLMVVTRIVENAIFAFFKTTIYYRRHAAG